MAKTTRKFKAEVRQLLDLVVHSLYSKKEIFLRELISNASDAIDRARFESLTDKSIAEDAGEWRIRIETDREARTLTVSDNGIGMSGEEVEKNIGTIANSGTRNFLASLAEKKPAADLDFIGQFGVGFYSAFMAADRVTLVTRRGGKGHAAVRWTSSGSGSYSIEETEKEGPGTDVVLTLREGLDEYLEEGTIRRVVKQYSDYIEYPIVMKTAAAGDRESRDETLNSMKAVWLKPKDQVSPEAYREFYRHISHDFADPLKVIHFFAEGATEFRALLYLPGHAPFDLLMPTDSPGLHLYVKNVFINDNCRELLPPYLRFVRGVVDSSDLPLNISREVLQDHVLIRRIRKSLVGRILNALTEMAEKEPENYRTFYTHFGRVLKEGLHLDPGNADKIKELLRFPSTKTGEGTTVSLRDYVDRMPSGQKEIYYLNADGLETAANSPHLEVFKSWDYEVLFLADPIDEWLAPHLTEYDGKKLRAVDRGEIDLADGESPEKEEAGKKAVSEEHRKLLDFIREQLRDDISDVRLSSRLTDSACCLAVDEGAMSPGMERMLQALNQPVPHAKRILEINPGHPVVKGMKKLAEQGGQEDLLGRYCELLHGQALLVEGSRPGDPARFTRLLSDLMAKSV